MLNKNTKGIWTSVERENWYYIDGGPHFNHSNTINKLKNVLVQRNLISYTDQEALHKVMTYQEAQEAKLNILPIYLNKHVATVAKQQEEESVASPWD